MLCVLGDAAFAKTARALLGAESVEHEVRGRDERMGTAFRAAAFRSDPSLTKEDLAADQSSPVGRYFLSKNFGAGAALSTARRMLALGARLLDAGGTAMKCDSSGIAHGRARWRALAKRGDDEALFHAFVQYPMGPVRNDYYTCGLHLLGYARPRRIGRRPSPGKPAASGTLFSSFALYLLTESARRERFARATASGSTAGRRRTGCGWEPCRGYDEDDFFFNSFGRYRFARR